MDKYNNTTSVLSVSAKRGKLNDCSEIVEFMKKIGIASSIIENNSKDISFLDQNKLVLSINKTIFFLILLL